MALVERTTIKYYIRKYIFRPIIWFFNILAWVLYKVTPKSWWTLNEPIFIIGCPRSGTTIFEKLFREHADLCSWTEAGQIFQTAYYKKDMDHILTADDLNSFDEARIKVFFQMKRIFQGKARFVNKNPRSSLRIDYLLALYPSAWFIHVIRDGRAVVNSNNTATVNTPFRRKLPFGGFCKPPLWRDHVDLSLVDQFAHQWVEVVEYISEKRPSIEDRYVEIRYEDFCKDTHAHLTALDRFVKLDPERRLRDEIPKELNSQNMKWRQRLSEDEIDSVNRIIKNGLQRYHYSV